MGEKCVQGVCQMPSDAGMCNGTQHTKDVMYMGTSTQIQVSVTPNCAGDTSTGWSFSLSCPK